MNEDQKSQRALLVRDILNAHVQVSRTKREIEYLESTIEALEKEIKVMQRAFNILEKTEDN